MDEPQFILATSSGAADRTFYTLASLAKAIVLHRDEACAGAELRAITAFVARSALPYGACVAVRMMDGSEDLSGKPGKGALIGYAFMPETRGNPAVRLMEAIVALEPLRVAA
jgi:hypothetical protein